MICFLINTFKVLKEQGMWLGSRFTHWQMWFLAPFSGFRWTPPAWKMGARGGRMGSVEYVCRNCAWRRANPFQLPGWNLGESSRVVSLWKEEKLQMKRENCSGSGFFNLGTLDILKWIILCREWSWACRLLNSVPDLHPPERSTPPSQLWPPKIFKTQSLIFFLKA